MGHRIGVDIGGTFTDFCILDETSGEMRSLKVLSTPDQPGQEVIAGLREIEHRYRLAPSHITYFTHGTTVGVNTVIQRKGAQLALFTTAGFEDVLEIARLKMPDPYDLFSRRPEPLVPRERVWGLAERTLADGTVAKVAEAENVTRAVRRAREEGADTIIVALLHAYANPANEHRVRDLIVKADAGIAVTLSSEVWPVIREYERTVTATVAGYVQARVARYLTHLVAALRDAGVAPEPMITKSNGGVMRAELGKTSPIQMLLSGTASGVIGAARIAEQAGARSVLSFDVGGTSADVAIIADGRPSFGVGEMVGEFPIHIPTVSVTSIGAGGGSIASVNEFGVLSVGPESAGANPGPACYGRGGTVATITDAYAVCGFIGGGELGYGAVSIDIGKARNVVGEIASRLRMSLENTAEAIIKVSISGMFLEVSKLFSRQGADPRQFALLPFGGAGPMTACFLARDLGLKRIIVPPTPGVLAAFGGLIADIRNDFIRSTLVDLDHANIKALDFHAGELAAASDRWLRQEQSFTGKALVRWSADMRYRGQSYEIEVPLDREWVSRGDVAAIAAAFHREHARVFEHADEHAPVQVVNLRAVISAAAPQPQAQRRDPTMRGAEPVAKTQVFYDSSWREAQLFERRRLAPGEKFSGPAIVRQDDCTTCLVGGFEAVVDPYSNLVITREG